MAKDFSTREENIVENQVNEEQPKTKQPRQRKASKK